MTAYYVTPAGSIIDDGLTPATAFDWASYKAWCEGVALPGDVAYLLSGTYTATLGVSSNTQDGTAAAPIDMGIGVTSFDSLAEATGTDRPLLNLSAGAGYIFDNEIRFRNLRISGNRNGSHMVSADINARIANCLVENAGTGPAVELGSTFGSCDSVEAVSTGGTAFAGTNQGHTWTDCIARDSVLGFSIGNSYNVIERCIIRDCTTGLDVNQRFILRCIANTFYNCGTAITGTGVGQGNLFLANIIDSCTASAVWAAARLNDRWDFNTWWNSGAPVNVTPGPNASYDNPNMVDPTAGTVEGLRVRHNGSRRQGLTLYTRGGVAPSIFDTGPNLATPSGPLDLSAENEIVDGTETVELDGNDIPLVLRHREGAMEGDPTDGVYTAAETTFDFPPDEAYYLGFNKPTIGGTIIDSEARTYIIQSVTYPRPFENFYGCVARRLVLEDTYSLDDTVTLFPAVDTLSAMGSRVTTHPTADATFTDVAAKIMLRPSEVTTKFGQKQFVEQYDVYVAEDIGQLRNADILKDQDLKQYAIVSYRNRDSIADLSVILCEDMV